MALTLEVLRVINLVAAGLLAGGQTFVLYGIDYRYRPSGPGQSLEAVVRRCDVHSGTAGSHRVSRHVSSPSFSPDNGGVGLPRR